MSNGMLIGVPIPATGASQGESIEAAIRLAVAEAEQVFNGIKCVGKSPTCSNSQTLTLINEQTHPFNRTFL